VITRSESRAVFVTVRRPYRQLTPEAVRQIMGRACDRAGLERRGVHRLRHALATEMRFGVDTSVIALWLGHENAETTQVYLHEFLGYCIRRERNRRSRRYRNSVSCLRAAAV